MVWVSSMLAYLTVNLFTWRTANLPEPRLREILTAWQQWDAEFYLSIAADGYDLSQPDMFAFFPGYPMLVAGAHSVLPGGHLLAALTVSAGACLAALILLHRLAVHEFGLAVADRAVFALMAFPTAFFLIAPYNEALFLALCLGCLYAARRQHWWLAGLLGAAASGTRLFGVLLLVPLAVEYLRQRHWNPRAIRPNAVILATVPMGLLAWSVFCWHRTGDPLAFARAQDAWERTYVPPGASIVDAVIALSQMPVLDPQALSTAVDVALMVLVLVLLSVTVHGRWRFREDQIYLTAFAAAWMLLMLSTEVGFGSPLASTPRLFLELVPLWLILGRITVGRLTSRAFFMVGMALQAVLLLTYLGGKWVA